MNLRKQSRTLKSSSVTDCVDCIYISPHLPPRFNSNSFHCCIINPPLSLRLSPSSPSCWGRPCCRERSLWWTACGSIWSQTGAKRPRGWWEVRLCSLLREPFSSQPTGSSSRERPPTRWVSDDTHTASSRLQWQAFAASKLCSLSSCSGWAGGDPLIPHRLSHQGEEDLRHFTHGPVCPGGAAATILHLPGTVTFPAPVLQSAAPPCNSWQHVSSFCSWWRSRLTRRSRRTWLRFSGSTCTSCVILSTSRAPSPSPWVSVASWWWSTRLRTRTSRSSKENKHTYTQWSNWNTSFAPKEASISQTSTVTDWLLTFDPFTSYIWHFQLFSFIQLSQ